jgi:hypothetical protein
VKVGFEVCVLELPHPQAHNAIVMNGAKRKRSLFPLAAAAARSRNRHPMIASDHGQRAGPNLPGEGIA